MAKSTHILLAEQLAIQSLAKERRIAFQGMGKFGPDTRASEQSFCIDADVRVE
jgi:hypothetical protein